MMIKKSFSILVSVILLASLMNLTIGTHFCSGEVVHSKLLFGETHLGCEMPNMQEACDDNEKSSTDGDSFDKLPCCENEYQTLEAPNEFTIDTTQPPLNVNIAAVFVYTHLILDLFSEPTHHFYTEYNSPPLEKDIPVLFQTFLI